MDWSKYQGAIFNDVEIGDGHTVVEAAAGSGKTSTLLESLNYIPHWDDWLLTAFNKKIATELKNRAPETGEIRTLHSLGLRAVKERWPDVSIDTNKIWHFLDELVGKDRDKLNLKFELKEAVSLCKACLIDDPLEIDVLMDDYGIDVVGMEREEFISLVSKLLLKSYEQIDTVDFDDMIWLPNMYDLKVGSYQRVFIDEAQDLNPAQIELSLSACAPGGRITIFCDRYQAIYQFRAAGVGTVENLIKRLDAKVLPLSISYRCPIKVVNRAKQYSPTIEAAPNAKEGILEYISSKEMLKMAKPGCFILSRINAPLIGLALGFIRQGTPCNIQGRDIGANLQSLIKKSKKKTTPAFINWLNKWEEKETKRLKEKNRSTVAMMDKAECLRTLAEDSTSVAEMQTKIQDLFEDGDDHDRVILSTVHRAKGLERDVVFILSETFFLSGPEVPQHPRISPR